VQPNADPYRTPAERPGPKIIDFRHFSPVWMAVFGAFVLLFPVLTAHRVDLVCERDAAGAGACVATDRHSFWSSMPLRFDVATVRGAKVIYGRKGVSRVVLVTTAGEFPLSSSSESSDTDEKQAMVAGVQGFLPGSGEARLEAGYGSRFFQNLWASVAFSPFLLVFALMSRRVRVVVDRAEGEVRIERSRFPLGPSVESWYLDEVEGATLEASSSGRGGPTYRVALLLRGGQRVPLTRGYSSGLGGKERVIAAIREALAESA
jgi:hypothetical protein